MLNVTMKWESDAPLPAGMERIRTLAEGWRISDVAATNER
jgi:hypothetical protein